MNSFSSTFIAVILSAMARQGYVFAQTKYTIFF